VGLDDVHRALQSFRNEQGESGLVLHLAIGGIRFVRELETDAAAILTDDPHTDGGVESPSGRVGSGQDLDRPVGERQHEPSLGVRDRGLRADAARVTGYGIWGGFEVTCNLNFSGFRTGFQEGWSARW
jgi:hypothetical protein